MRLPELQPFRCRSASPHALHQDVGFSRAAREVVHAEVEALAEWLDLAVASDASG